MSLLSPDLQISEDRFEAKPYTRGPWDAGAQHAGPPAALMGRAVEWHAQAAAGGQVDL